MLQANVVLTFKTSWMNLYLLWTRPWKLKLSPTRNNRTSVLHLIHLETIWIKKKMFKKFHQILPSCIEVDLMIRLIKGQSREIKSKWLKVNQIGPIISKLQKEATCNVETAEAEEHSRWHRQHKLYQKLLSQTHLRYPLLLRVSPTWLWRAVMERFRHRLQLLNLEAMLSLLFQTRKVLQRLRQSIRHWHPKW